MPIKTNKNKLFHQHHLFGFVQGVSKQMHLKEMSDFLTLKMLPVALVLIKPEKCYRFAPLVKKTHFA